MPYLFHLISIGVRADSLASHARDNIGDALTRENELRALVIRVSSDPTGHAEKIWSNLFDALLSQNCKLTSLSLINCGFMFTSVRRLAYALTGNTHLNEWNLHNTGCYWYRKSGKEFYFNRGVNRGGDCVHAEGVVQSLVVVSFRVGTGH